jgi:hypothetical protein
VRFLVTAFHLKKSWPTNFKLLLTGAKNIRTAEILAKMKTILTEAP